MKLKVDYHFHPNLPDSHKRAMRKCKRIWKNFAHHDIRAVIITEHAYKDPRHAYDLMRKTAPEGFTCFPGVECISSEGVDQILFSAHDDIYDYAEIEPFRLSYSELLSFITHHDDIFGFVTHPYLPSKTGVVYTLGEEVFDEAVKKLGAVEISGESFGYFGEFFDWHWPAKTFKYFVASVRKTRHLPKSDYPEHIKFLAAGSDAHTIDGIGDCLEIFCDKHLDREGDLFRQITSNCGRTRIISRWHRFKPDLIIKKTWIVWHEYRQKRKLM